jgi:hypothetical protein
MNKIKYNKERYAITLLFSVIMGFTFCKEKKEDNTTNLLIGAAALNSTSRSNAATYSIGGTVSELFTTGLVLQNNSGDDVNVTATSGTNSGSFTFNTKVSGSYTVTIKTQPTSATCTVTKGTGIATANVTDVSVSCVTNIGGAILKALNLTGAVTVFAGPANGSTATGTTDGTGTTARFSNPTGIATDGTNLYVTEQGNVRIRRIVISTGVVTTFAGSTFGNADGTGTAAQFNNPCGIVSDGTNLYVTDYGSHRIRRIVIATAVVTTLAGSSVGNTDATGTAALFNSPCGITTEGTNLYVADQSNHRIRRIVISTGVVTTLAGSSIGTVDGTGTSAQFTAPSGITTDGTNLFVTDLNSHRIRRIVISTGVVTTFAGSSSGSTDGTGTAALFNSPFGIITDGTNLFIAENGNRRIRRIVIGTGVVTTLAGSTIGDLDGTGTAAQFGTLYNITSDGTSLYVAEGGNNKIRRIQ